MASRNLRRSDDMPSNDLLPINYHGLETKEELRAYTEQFHLAKEEISQGKRRRRNSTNDCRTQATIEASGPDHRFNDIAIEDSGIRDSLNAIKFMPPYPSVQDYTRRSARWDDIEQVSASENEELEESILLGSLSDSSNFAPHARTGAKASKRGTRSHSESTSIKTVPAARQGSTNVSTSKVSTTDGIFYKCYATNCNYQHARRSNFSIHWKRDAKHPGTFDLAKVLQCSQDQAGKITTVPYGNIKSHRQRLSSGTRHEVDIEEASMAASSSDVEDTTPSSGMRKVPFADLQRATRTTSSTVPITNEATTQQESNTAIKEIPDNTSQSSSVHIYSSSECQIYRRLADVPADFPAHTTPLITHGAPDTNSLKTSTTDCRFFCPECDKCFTQTHNVASHFGRHHGKQYSKNDRARTVCCRVTISQNGVNIDAKPLDDTILPRLQQIRQDRNQTVQSQGAANVSTSNVDIQIQKDVSSNRKPESLAEPAKSLVTTDRTIQSGLLSSPTVMRSTRDSPQAQNSRQSSKRVRRMHAVRESILARVATSPFSAPDGAGGPTAESDTTAKTNDATSATLASATNANADHQPEGIQPAGIFGLSRLSIAEAGSIAALNRQPSWQETTQTAQGPRVQKRKRSGDSNGSAWKEEIECTDDEMEDDLMGQEAKPSQKECDAVEGKGDGAQKSAKRQKTLIEYLGLEGYSSD